MKLLIKIFVCALFLTSSHVWAGTYEAELQKISTDFGAALGNSKLNTVAIVSFKNLDGKETNLGKFLAGEISVNLVNQNKNISVVDRANLDKIMQEQKLTEEGLVDPENAKKLKLAGIDAIIFGTIVPLSGSYHVDLQAIATDTAKVVAAERGMITRTDELDTMMGIANSSSSNGSSGAIQIPATSGSDSSGGAVAKQKTYDVGPLTFEIKSVSFFKRSGKIRVIYTVTHDRSGINVDSFLYNIVDRNNPPVAYRSPSDVKPPDYEVIGGATDDAGNSYKMTVPSDAQSAPQLPPGTAVSFQVEYQIETDGNSTIQLPSKLTFWFEYYLGFNIGDPSFRTGRPVSKFSAADYPIDHIR